MARRISASWVDVSYQVENRCSMLRCPAALAWVSETASGQCPANGIRCRRASFAIARYASPDSREYTLTKSAPSRLAWRTAWRASSSLSTSMKDAGSPMVGAPSMIRLPMTHRGPSRLPPSTRFRHSWKRGEPAISRTVVTPLAM
jgi:hypothetical protein